MAVDPTEMSRASRPAVYERIENRDGVCPAAVGSYGLVEKGGGDDEKSDGETHETHSQQS